MQGYILNIFRVRDEDLIVNVLTPNRFRTLYRFYGARHSTIQIGYKIDFEIDSSNASKLPLLRGVHHLGFKWLYDVKKTYLWQTYIKLFYNHLKGVEELGRFYFDLLEDNTRRWEKQNPKRIIIESYTKLLEAEGRLHKDFKCFVCERDIRDDIVLVRGFLPSHKECVFGKIFTKWRIEELFLNHSSIFLNDDEVDLLYEIVCEGF